MELLPALNAFTVFLAIAAVGFVFLMVSLFFGEIFEHFDTSLDHDLDHGGPGFFSPRVMSVFVTTFGGAGAIATFYGWSPVLASLVGFGSGVALSSLVVVFARFLYRQQASSDMRSTDLVGQPGRVVIAIPAGGVGQVRCRVGEELIDKIAQARDGTQIPENAAVRIEEILGETVIVTRQ
jgi:membrane protein implicated in regulation of membrane protease activity